MRKVSSSEYDADLLKSIDLARSHYFGSFQPLRASIYEAGLEGEKYPLTSQDWILQSTAAIDTLLGVQSASITKMEQDVSAISSESLKELTISGFVILVGLLTGIVALFVVLMKVIKPLADITLAMNVLAEGDHQIEIPALGRKDEIGQIASSVQVFKENAVEKVQLEKRQIENERRAVEEKNRAMEELAGSFDKQVGGVISSLSSAATQLQSTAESMRAIADKTAQSSSTVASSAEEASSNVATVASAMEEMSVSSNEIASQVVSASTKSNDTAQNASKASDTVGNLNGLVENIGEVVTSIKDIAEQTNLLALNATIEAARAGEAGKGFAVVADEVKKLANETAQKTEEIDSRITKIQAATRDSVDAMQRIIDNISDINSSVGGVSAAVEEQNATNSEIVRSVGETSQGVQDVARIILEVQRGAGETGTSADAVLCAAKNMSDLSNELKASVDKFLDGVRNAS